MGVGERPPGRSVRRVPAGGETLRSPLLPLQPDLLREGTDSPRGAAGCLLPTRHQVVPGPRQLLPGRHALPEGARTVRRHLRRHEGVPGRNVPLRKHLLSEGEEVLRLALLLTEPEVLQGPTRSRYVLREDDPLLLQSRAADRNQRKEVEGLLPGGPAVLRTAVLPERIRLYTPWISWCSNPLLPEGSQLLLRTRWRYDLLPPGTRVLSGAPPQSVPERSAVLPRGPARPGVLRLGLLPARTELQLARLVLLLRPGVFQRQVRGGAA